MDGQERTTAAGTQPDAAETIRQQQRGDTPTTKPEGENTNDAQATAQAPVVDLAQPEQALVPPKATGEAQGLAPATISGDTITFEGGATVQRTAQAGEVVQNERGALVVQPPAAEARTPQDAPPSRPDTAGSGEQRPETAVGPENVFGPEYSTVSGNDKTPLPPEVEKQIADKLAEYKKQIDDSNYSISFAKGEGPWNSITRQQNEARAKQKAGQELSPTEAAILALKPDEVMREAFRIRDRDFKVMKTDDGRPRNWYKVNEKTGRWTEQEVKDMMAAQEKTLREGAEKQIREAAEKAKAEEALAERQRLAAAIDKNVPSEAIVQGAATKAGIEGDPKQIRDAMKEHVTREIQEGTLKPEDLNNPYPRVGAALVGAGALTAEELKSALAEQVKQTKEGERPPRLDSVLQGMFKDNPEKLAKLDKASKFYDELKRLTDEAKAQEAVMPAAPPEAAPSEIQPFDPRYSEVPPAQGPVDGPPPPAAQPEPRREATPPREEAPPPPGATPDVQRPRTQADILREVTEAQPATQAGELKQAPSAYLSLKAFQAAGLDTRNWTATNDAQRAVAEGLRDPKVKAELAGLPPETLDGKASVGDVTPVNDFLKGKGLDIQLNPIGENDIAFAATLAVKGQWAGTATELQANGQTYKAVDLSQNVQSWDVNGQTVVRLYSANGMEVYASPMPDDASGEKALARAQELTPASNQNAKPGRFGAARIPMVKMDASTQLTDLVGMQSDKGETISQAQMQTKLNLDENGFSVDQGLALAASRSISRPESFTFDKPFLLWVRTTDGSRPLAAVRVDERFWKDPKQK